jgi:hypothetical protein
MIFGKTWRHKRRERNLRAVEKIYGLRKFAWLPTQLSSGQYAWLVPYYEYSYWDCCWEYDDGGSRIADAWVVPPRPGWAPIRELTDSPTNVYRLPSATVAQFDDWVHRVQNDVG